MRMYIGFFRGLSCIIYLLAGSAAAPAEIVPAAEFARYAARAAGRRDLRIVRAVKMPLSNRRNPLFGKERPETEAACRRSDAAACPVLNLLGALKLAVFEVSAGRPFRGRKTARTILVVMPPLRIIMPGEEGLESGRVVFKSVYPPEDGARQVLFLVPADLKRIAGGNSLLKRHLRELFRDGRLNRRNFFELYDYRGVFPLQSGERPAEFVLSERTEAALRHVRPARARSLAAADSPGDICNEMMTGLPNDWVPVFPEICRTCWLNGDEVAPASTPPAAAAH